MNDKYEVIFDNRFITVSYDYENKWVYAQWRGNLDFDRIRIGFDHILHVIRLKNCAKVINDNSLAKTEGWAKALDWTKNEWYPKAMKAGLKKSTFVIHEENINKTTNFFLDNSISKQELTCLNQYFSTLEKAKVWLK